MEASEIKHLQSARHIDQRRDAQAQAILAAARVVGSYTRDAKRQAAHDCCRALIESLRS